MAIVEDVPDTPPATNQPRRRPGKGKQSAGGIPLGPRPSEIIAAAAAAGGSRGASKGQAGREPLVSLGLEDLKAAGVSFHEVDGAGNPLEQSGEDEYEYVDEEEMEVYDSDVDGAGCADDEADERTDEEREAELWWDEFFDSMLYTVPFSFLYLMLAILTNLSYNNRPTITQYAKDYVVALIAVGVIVFYTSRHAKNMRLMNVVALVSIICGMRLIWLVNKANWLVVIAQGPPIGTLWIITVVQLPLGRAVIALSSVAAWAWYNNMKLRP